MVVNIPCEKLARFLNGVEAGSEKRFFDARNCRQDFLPQGCTKRRREDTSEEVGSPGRGK